MNKIIFVGVNTEQRAYEAEHALHEMSRDGTITLYNDAVVVKQPDGTIAVREQPDAGPRATLGGMITGGLIGLLGGPIGAAVGLGAGTLVGAAFDLTRQGIDEEFVQDVGALLEPGKAAVIAEIDEEWQVPLDTRMEALGGNVLRRTPAQIQDAYAERDIEALEKELATLEAEQLADVQASQTKEARKHAEKLQAKIDAVTRRVRAKEDQLTAQLESLKEESRMKVALLEAQKATAKAESQAALERRLADVRGDYARRVKRLNEMREHHKAAAHGTTVA